MKFITPIALSSLLLVGCVSSAPNRIDNALLSELTPESMATVSEARSARDVAEDKLANADRDLRWAGEQVELTRSSLEVARATLDESKLAMVVAERSGTVDQFESSQREHAYSAARADEVRDLLSLHKREFEHAKLARKLALEEHRLTIARVELAKAEAVQELQRVAAKRVPLDDYKKQVRFHETEVELARVRYAALIGDVSDARTAYETTRARAASLKAAN